MTEGQTYYFKVEPILWRILSQKNGTALILCDSILANGKFDDDGSNNYAQSAMRTWLNDQFYRVAFTDLEQQAIPITLVDNSAETTRQKPNRYACENTNDKIFLLAYAEAINSNYGFRGWGDYDRNRDMLTSDYSRATGAYMATSGDDVYGYGGWWLRSPSADFGNSTYTAAATINSAHRVNYAAMGVVPAMQIQLSLATCKHEFGNWGVITPPSCIEAGEERRVCSCGVYDSREIPATGEHNYIQGVCDGCGAKDYDSVPLYVREGNKIYFGEYPQSAVTDATLISALNAKAGVLPTSANAQKWTSYGYYMSGEVENYMWYIDVVKSGEKYRGVYFTSYRPLFTTTHASSSFYQELNGYATSTVYWFRYEPITWTILQEQSGTALLLCDMIIDSRQFSDGASDSSNDYVQSTLRTWLNDTFLETAFAALQQEIILTTTVDNGEDGNTQDKIFLLSRDDLLHADYGFVTDDGDNATRQKQTTAYAQAQGAYTDSDTYNGNGVWWLRTHNIEFVNNVSESGNVIGGAAAFHTNRGIVPALQIQLN